MTGYTPIFSSVFDGTLHGKWPQTGVWLALLAMADRHGHIDRSPQAIASDIGVPVDVLMGCIREFCEPDEMSRTRDHDGRRLELIDADRPWGWRVLNHGKYREKARKMAFDQRRTESGRDAERKRHSRDVPRCPDASRAGPPSNTNTNKEEEGAGAPLVVGTDPEAWSTWVGYRKTIGKPLNPKTYATAQKQMAALGARQMVAVEHSIANNYRGLFAPDEKPTAKIKSHLPQEVL